ncbi:uncharacterized protein LOC129602129 [Paramacrobiotus metropolitanus]|uniref:uncharacterized protein LOC129602129 n=1 Tax=Paramacrobiotus metropolitanus TaxID=2943436 RepID=UPI002445FEDB|nr:uncharacterized protein LOC129602129 [Paramacrobiotus metropolitanus]
MCACRPRTAFSVSLQKQPAGSGCFLLLLLLPLTAGCPTFAPKPAPVNLKDMLAEALLQQRDDDRVVLSQMAPSKFLASSVVYRPRLGEDAVFNCSVPADVDWHDVSWLHEHWTVFRDGHTQPLRERDTTGQTYNFTRVNDTLILVVRNVTLRSGGLVYCVIPPYAPTARRPEREYLQRFLLLPLVTRRSEVFAATNETSVTVSEGAEVTLQCSMYLPLPEGILGNFWNHLMWVHQGRIIHAPWEKPYGFPPSLLQGPGAVEPNYYIGRFNSPGRMARAFVLFRAVTLADAGDYQCWFRPHHYLHEWIAQNITLLVVPKNNTQCND